MKIVLKLYDKNGKTIVRKQSEKKTVFPYFLRTAQFKTGYLKVVYDNGTAYNDTEEKTDKATLYWALKNFTDKELVNTFK